MVRRFRVVRVLKWAGTVVCVLILAAYVTSAWYSISWGNNYFGIGINNGQLMNYYDFDGNVAPAPRNVYSHAFNLYWALFYRDPATTLRNGYVHFPLWLPFVVALVTTLLLWLLDRRVPRGYCRRCRYDLTGNTTGRCPECGAAFALAAR